MVYEFIANNILTLIFYAIVIILVIINRKKFDLHGIIALYRAKWGLKLMDRAASKFPKTIKTLSYIGVVVGFIGMIAISYFLIQGAYSLLTAPETQGTVSLVLPGIRFSGSQFYIPLFSGIISIFLVAAIHEFSHGVVARSFKVKVKNSGIVFFGPILGAFVEPDEKKVEAIKKREQLAIYAAGPFSNIITGILLVLIISFVITPAIAQTLDFNGVVITDIGKDSPADLAKLSKNEVLTSIDNVAMDNLSIFSEVLSNKKPGETVSIMTDKGEYNIKLATHPSNESKSFLGVTVKPQKTEVNPSYQKFGKFPLLLENFYNFLFIFYVLSIGIGLFNLLPLGPIDGGRMLKTALEKFFDKSKSNNIWKSVSWFFLFILIINIVFSFI